jgi:hypothetical protein
MGKRYGRSMGEDINDVDVRVNAHTGGLSVGYAPDSIIRAAVWVLEVRYCPVARGARVGENRHYPSGWRAAIGCVCLTVCGGWGHTRANSAVYSCWRSAIGGGSLVSISCVSNAGQAEVLQCSDGL